MSDAVPGKEQLYIASSTADDALRSGTYCTDIVAFHDFWCRKRGRRTMPARRDFDPVDMIPFLPGIALIDVVDDDRRFVYRLMGTREVAMRGNDPTGKGVTDGYFATSAEAALASYDDVVARRAPRFEQRRFVTPDGRIGNEQTVILPLSEDGQAINMIIAYTHHYLV
ncbi:MAG: PAS domain-containing protein [Rhodospirillaceae bacterium]|nr:PAS domain-containing protein [Rhodospirillaceae bacterium]